MRGVLAEHLLEQRRVSEDVEHKVYPGDALVGEVVPYESLQEVSTFVDVLDEERLIEGEVHLKEANYRLHDRVKLVAELKQEKGCYLGHYSSLFSFSFSSSSSLSPHLILIKTYFLLNRLDSY